MSFTPCPVAVESLIIVNGVNGISGSKTVSKCPIRKSFLPFLPFLSATRCPARLMESGMGTQLHTNPAFSSSLAYMAPTFLTPSIFNDPLLILADVFSNSTASLCPDLIRAATFNSAGPNCCACNCSIKEAADNAKHKKIFFMAGWFMDG